MTLIQMSQRHSPETLNLPQHPARIVRLFPMLCVQAYLTFTVVLFAVGPWPWPVSNPFTLYTFLILAQLALWFGYIFSLSKKPTRYIGYWTWERLFNVSIVLSLLWIIPNFMNRLGLSSLDLNEILLKIALGLSDPGNAYVKRLALEEEMGYTGGLVAYLTILVSPFLQMLMPLGITYWKLLAPWKRKLMLFWVVADMFTWVASGTNKGIADLLFLVPFFVIVRNPNIIAKINIVRVIIVLCILTLSFYAFLTFFSLGMESRPGSASMIKSDYTTGIEYDDSNFILGALPESMHGGVASFCTYLTQGYYGLSLCLNEPFTWSYGLGHSYYLPSWYKKIDPASDIALLSYPGRVGIINDWGYLNRWHSIYPWLASDVSFPGTFIIMFLIGRLFAKTWQDILWCENPIATALFGMVLIMLFYVPANNQVLGFPASAFAFWILLIWWLRTRRMFIN